MFDKLNAYEKAIVMFFAIKIRSKNNPSTFVLRGFRIVDAATICQQSS